MEFIIDYIKTYNYKKLVFPIFITIICILEFIYLNDKINKKEITKIETIKIEEPIVEETIIKEEYIYVDVKGAVKKPGVYKLDVNSRVIDAINISGGLIKTSNTTYTNLSKVLTDSEIVRIYTNEEIKNMNEKEIQIIEECKCEQEKQKNNLVNINISSKEELKTLSGIGDAKAEAIIEYRNTNGDFSTIEDLKKVEGISETLYEKIKDFITIQ